MKFLVLATAAFLSLAISSVNAGQGREGGDAVLCRDTDGIKRMFSLDYILTMDNKPYVSLDADVDETAHLARVVRVFETHLKGMFLDQDGLLIGSSANNFREFMNSYTQRRRGQFSATWIPTSLDLLDIKDEQMDAPLTAACEQNIFQSVIKVRNVFYYDTRIENQLIDTGKGQASFQAIHELLRSATADSRLIRKWNRIMHRPEFVILPKNRLIQFLLENNMISIYQIERAEMIEKIMRGSRSDARKLIREMEVLYSEMRQMDQRIENEVAKVHVVQPEAASAAVAESCPVIHQLTRDWSEKRRLFSDLSQVRYHLIFELQANRTPAAREVVDEFLFASSNVFVVPYPSIRLKYHATWRACVSPEYLR